MKLLSAEQILEAQDLPTVDIDVPEWGGTVRLQALTGVEREAFHLAARDQKLLSPDAPNVTALLVSFSARDESGGRLFTDAQVEALGKRSGVALTRLFEAAAKLSLLTDQDVDTAAKN